MRQINCYIPIKLRITGRLSDAQLEQLGESLIRTLTERIAFAERTIALRNRDYPHQGETELVQEVYDPSRDRVATYAVPAYDNRGERRGVALRRRSRQERLWRVRHYFNIFLTVETFIEYLESIAGSTPTTQELRSLYIDRFSDTRPVEVRYIETIAPMFVETLVQEVQEHVYATVPASQELYFGYTVRETDRRRLEALDETNRVSQLPDMSYNPGGHDREGRGFFVRGGKLLFLSIRLPVIQIDETLHLGMEFQVSLRMRDLDFIIDPSSFEEIYDVSWQNYIQEFGDELETLRILPVFAARRVHYNTLEFLVRREVVRQIERGVYYFGGLRLLNQSTLDWLPAPARTAATEWTDDITRPLSAAQERGEWEPDWSGAFIYTVLRPSEDQLNAARYRPEARRLVVPLIEHLRGDPRELIWPYNFLSFLRGTPSGIGFEYLLEELENRGWFQRLFSAVEEAEYWDLHELLIQRASNTRYADHPRVRQSVERINSRRRSSLNHAYIVTDTSQELRLEKRSDARVRPRQILADVWSRYFGILEEQQRIKPSKKADFERILQEEARSLIDEILTGQDSSTYTQEEFSRTALEKTVRRIGVERFQADYIETVDYQISARLLEIQRVEGLIERYRITYELVRRVEGESWEDIPNSRRTVIDGEFEEMLVFWGIQRSAVAVETLAKIVSFGAIAVVAWEVGAIAFLIELGGGAVAVGVSIAISELIYFFTAENHSLEGFLLAALDGYLFAIGFRFAGFVGRSIATRIGTDSITRTITGWITERLVVGTLGGASSAALTTFSHDLIDVLLGRGGWSTPQDYIRNMSIGAALGIVFEFGAAPLQPLLRVTGRTAIETVDQVVQRIRAEGISLPRWSALSTEALSNLRQRLETFLEPGMARRISEAFRQRVAQVSEGLAQLPSQAQQLPGQARQLGRQAIFRRVLELSEASLTREATQGLEKLISASVTHLDDEVALQFFNGLKNMPGQVTPFLEAVNLLDDVVLGQLTRTRQIESLVRTPEILRAISYDPVISAIVQQVAQLSASEATTRIGGLLRVARSGVAVPESPVAGAFFARGGTSELFRVADHPELLLKSGGGRLPREAQVMVELEMMGIPTVYAATRQTPGTQIVVRYVEGVGSKDIIGRLRQPLNPPRHVEVITQRTIDDLERIYGILERNRANVGDFQFIVRRSDGAVFVNDPVSLNFGRGPSGSVGNIIDRFRSILRRSQEGG